MTTKNKRLIIVILCSFLGGLLFSFTSGSKTEPDNQKKDSLKKTLPSTVKNRKTTSPAFSSVKKNSPSMIALIRQLQGTPDIETLNELFDEAFHPKNGLLIHTNSKKWLIVNKWGKEAPKQGLAKLENIKDDGLNYLFPLFSGWASKNPEAAMAFYEENYKKDPQKYPYRILNAIISEYAKQSPKKAWDYLTAQTNVLSEEELQKSQNIFLRAVSQKNPELIPEFAQSIGRNKMEKDAYLVGIGWGMHNPESKEWLKYLSDDNKIKVEAGIIMGATQGNLEQISSQLSSIPPENKIKVITELANNLQDSGGLNIYPKINWIVDNLPEAEMTEELQARLQSSLREDPKDSKSWIDSLPSGKKKSFLQKLYNQNQN